MRTPDVNLPSKSDQVIALAEALGVPLLPWQIHVLDDALKYKADGKFARRTIGVLVARQNGKSHLMRMRILAGLFLWDESWVSMAQNRKLAWEQFNQATQLVLNTPWLRDQVKRVSHTNGNEYLELKSGAKWSIVAATKDGPRGYTANLWVDELRDITPEAWKASTPITRAVPGAQVWTTSNAGDAHSSVLNDLRSKALKTSEASIGWYEWSADPSLNIKDKVAWYQANPALGHLIDEDVIAQAAATDRPEAFRTESLCLWVDAIESPWPMGSWEACSDKALKVTPGLPTWLAIDVTPARRRADLVAAQLQEDGRIAIGLLATWESESSIDENAIALEISKWVKTYRARLVAFDRWTGNSIASKLSHVGIPVGDVSGQMFAQACDETLSSMTTGKLVHAGQPDLTAHFMACARKPVADGGWRVIRKGSATDISAACAAIMVVHHALVPERKAIIVSA